MDIETKENITCEIIEYPPANNVISMEVDCLEQNNNERNAEEEEHEVEVEEDEASSKPAAKKRGRKPKGGKIIQQIIPSSNLPEVKSNVILHLKCSLNDLKKDPASMSNVESFNFDKGDLSYDIIMNNNNNSSVNNPPVEPVLGTKNSMSIVVTNNHKKLYDEYDNDHDDHDGGEIDNREIWRKLKQLEHNLHINNISDKKSACFWCTYDFDNPPTYIPKHFIKETYHVYGCFCCPECATAYLMEENIDSSTKFERYHLMNHMYSKIYDFKKNIKPAANPYYMLEKFYGNLSIQEYRALLRNERLFLVVDKPLTRILPELHEDNDDFMINHKIIPSNTYQVKKKMNKKGQNNSIFTDKFSNNSSSHSHSNSNIISDNHMAILA